MGWLWTGGDRNVSESLSPVCAREAHIVVPWVIPGDRLGIAQTPLLGGVCGQPGHPVDEAVD